ncbi:MAG: hypothetical protein COV69_00955 [Parcubacteria group bacterium CG11_big_fil_rev_8_21_14_0_20_39_14]|nr:MAG: hypothetical protein COV69_00955 [Parcubacteria group bacterium CG11_big_fil_rev_8_21_14_0_20_39_14]
MAKKMFGNLVKAVVNAEKGIMAIDGELHSDEELLLIENGSRRVNLWGVNLYPEFFGKDQFVEFDSLINIKPSQGNRSRGVNDQEIRKKILEIVGKLIIKD